MRPPRSGVATPVPLALVCATAAVLAPLLVAAPSAAAPGDCRRAGDLAALGEMTAAVALYDLARADGQACGESPAAGRAREELAAARQAEAPSVPATAAEPASTADPFAGAEALARLGRDDDARDAALAAVQAGASPPPGSRSEELLRQGWADRARLTVVRWVVAWWAALALALALGAVALAFVARRQTARRVYPRGPLRRVPPRLRLAVDVEQASGTQPDLKAGFAVQVRTRVRELSARYAEDPRVVYGSDAPVDVPLEAVPGQAKYVAMLWRWFAKSNTVTLKVTLLPASREGVGCHVVLLEQNGSASQGGSLSEQVLWHRPSHWRFDLSAESSWNSLQWMPLANLVTAWALYAFRSLQASPETMEEEFGTRSGEAYGEMLAGLEEEDSPKAMRHFRQAIRIDPDFVEARLNLASALGGSTAADRLRREDLREAQELLDELVLRIDAALAQPGLPARVAVRWRGLWFRAQYSLVMLQFNKLAPILDQDDQREAAARCAGVLLTATRLLQEWVLKPEPDDRTGQLAVLKRQMEQHVLLLHAGALDLTAKLSGPPGSAPLPIDLQPTEATDAGQKEALEIIRPIPMTGTALRIHYTLACTWARDLRMRPREPAADLRAALARCVERLDAALEDPLFDERWTGDPDLRPIAEDLHRALDEYREREAPRADGAVRLSGEPVAVPPVPSRNADHPSTVSS